MSTWLGYGAQLFDQTAVEVWLWRYFLDVINIYNQLTLSTAYYLHVVMGLTQSVAGLKNNDWDFTGKKDFFLMTKTQESCLGFQPERLPYRSQLASSHNCGTLSFHIHPSCFFLWRTLTNTIGFWSNQSFRNSACEMLAWRGEGNMHSYPTVW